MKKEVKGERPADHQERDKEYAFWENQYVVPPHSERSVDYSEGKPPANTKNPNK